MLYLWKKITKKKFAINKNYQKVRDNVILHVNIEVQHVVYEN